MTTILDLPKNLAPVFSISTHDMMYFLYLLILLTLCLHFFYKKKKKAQDATKPLPPGNTGWPVVGETLQYLSDGRRGHPERFVFDRIAKYSSCIFKTNLMMEETAVFCGAGANKFLFANENKLVQSWWPSTVNKIFPSSSQSSSKEEAIKMRKLLPGFFNPEALQRYVGIMDEIARTHFDAHWLENDCVIVYPLSKCYTFWLAAKIFISIENSNEVEKFLASLNTVSEGLISIPIDVAGTPFHHAIKASESIRKQLILIIKQRNIDLVEGKATSTQDILSHMLTTPDEDGKFMKEADVADKILGLLVGGYDTASSACAFVVKYLAEFPDVYQRVYNEQIEIVKSKREGELLNWDDIQSMKYSWNVAREVMRLAPPVQGAFRDVLTDFMFQGFYIPKGWKVYWSTHSTHRNPKHFSEPDKFDPSRFEGSGPAPYTFVPFGGGPRMCPGKEYARLEILVFMHNLVKRYKWEMVDRDEKIIVNPMPIPEKGLPIRLFPHEV